jgi:hypothetical protein
MAQITIYLPDEIENRARRAAKTARTSVSRWIADRLKDDLCDQWPKEVLAAAGAVPDFPSLKEIRGEYGKDARRENLD